MQAQCCLRSGLIPGDRSKSSTRGNDSQIFLGARIVCGRGLHACPLRALHTRVLACGASVEKSFFRLLPRVRARAGRDTRARAEAVLRGPGR